ncbi:DUF4998 domain-containing protein [Sphingobacterium faecale]|uniref:DUF4998 domain-containing protein n=1 Tax=Sphingobacterium faecale TaxID=2803775 RepID=A0ABS1R6V7_9SPHI|nr:DUF4998 domain-containing protein [Sphingobacterium faecale]MBL1410388.1 hypothetical protein [Sphingobacterium faecale]
MKYYFLKHTYFTKFTVWTAVLLIAVTACKKQDSTYRDVLEGKFPSYAGRPDSMNFHPGNNRAQISFRIKDPSVNKVIFYWNNRKDSTVYAIDQPSLTIHHVNIAPLEEKYHNIDFYTFYPDGTSSIKNTQMGNVYGNAYQSSLLNRLIESTVLRNDSLFINWYKAYPDLVGMEVRYIDMVGDAKTIVTDAAEEVMALPKFQKGGELKYRSIYLPDSLAIDSFYTEFKNLKI